MKISLFLGRTLFAILCCFLMSTPLFAQKTETIDVPEEVMQTFDFEQPNAKGVKWTLEKSIYLATFKSDGAPTMTYIKEDGSLIKTVYEIPRSSLPSSITDFVKTNYPTGRISVTELWEEPNVKIYYYIEIKPEDITIEPSILTFSDVGKLLSRKDDAGYVASAVESDPDSNDSEAGNTTQQGAAKPAKVKKEKEVAPALPNSVADNQVPEKIKKALMKKGIKPVGAQWFKEGGVYRAEMIYREQPSKFFVTEAGVWEKSLLGMDKKMVVGNTLMHIEKYYKGARIIDGVKEFRADKQDMIWINIIKKEDSKTKLVTELQFNKQGRFIREVPKVGDEMSNEYIPGAVKEAFKKKYPKVQGVEFKEDDEGYFLGIFYGMKGREYLVMEGNGMLIETRVEGNLGNVNPNIKGFIRSKIKGGKITEYYVVRSIVEKRNYFLVVVTESKTGIVHKLKFSTNGKIIQ